MDSLIALVGPVNEKNQRWAEFLSATLNPPQPRDFQFILELSSEEPPTLRDSEGRHLQIDFQNDGVNYQRKGLRGKNELLAKALGWSKGFRRVLDLSAGLGIDAVFMTQLGFSVTAIERSRLLFLLLREALEQSPAELQAVLGFINEDSAAYLRNSRPLQEIDVIYFDPMYPHKKKSALPKQEMVLFRELVGHDEDAAGVLAEALDSTAERVVVKRPLGAPELLTGVLHSFEGKVVRYDIYKR